MTTYIVTIFTSAFLLFLIQPMVAKMLLPQLGGSPAVWNTSMVFYQTVLLLGYLYTHVSHRLLGARGQAKLHLAVMGLSMLFIPLALNMDTGFKAALSPVSWLLLVLASSVGIPFFVLSANAPMVQSWFAHTGHKNSANPYFLYSASNLGSFLALLGYPFVIEYLIPLSFQAKLWSVLYGVFLVMLLGRPGWHKVNGNTSMLWTDDYSNILKVLK